MSNTRETGETAFAGVAAELHPLGAARSALFGMPCLKIGSKAFAGLAAQAMVFKLPADARSDALRLEGGAPVRSDGWPTDEGMGRCARKLCGALVRSGGQCSGVRRRCVGAPVTLGARVLPCVRGSHASRRLETGGPMSDGALLTLRRGRS